MVLLHFHSDTSSLLLLSKLYSWQIDRESSLFVLEFCPKKRFFFWPSMEPSHWNFYVFLWHCNRFANKEKRRNRKALLRACAELQSKSWKLVDMQGVEVPAKLLNFFLFFFYTSSFLYYLAKLLFLFFPPFLCPKPEPAVWKAHCP